MSTDEPLDVNDDLFDFDELLRDAELFAEPAPREAALQPQAAPPPALPVVAAPEATHRPPRRPPPLAPRPVVVPAPEPVAAAAVVAPEASAPAQFRVGRGLVLTLCGAAALNLAVLALVFQALGSVRGMVSEVGGRESNPPTEQSSLQHAPSHAVGNENAPPAEGETALARAAELLGSGEHQRARETLYALLAVSDRLPATSRADVEARARLLIADAWRLEADALERELVALAAEKEPAK
jgi:DNA polymerase III subunit gamma/tau